MNKEKIDMKDITILITFRGDSIERIENLMMVTEYLLQNFNTNIFVLQANSFENKILPRLLNRKIRYTFVEDRDSIFHRTKYHNQMTRNTETPYIAIWDTDIIVPLTQVEEAIQKLRGGVDISYPYDGNCYDTSYPIRELFWRKRRLSILKNNKEKMSLLFNKNLKGGVMFVNRISYERAGMENESFYGWGDEDFERYERWQNFGLSIYHVAGEIYHLSHIRYKSISGYRSEYHNKKSHKCLIETKNSNAIVSKETEML